MGKWKKDYETTSDNWNVADSYSKIKIMKLLAEIDEYIKIAKTGVSELADEFTVNPQTKINARILALNRLHMTLIMLIDNSSFGVKPKDEKLMDDWYKALKSINPNRTHNTVKNKEGFSSQTIQEAEFGIVLNKLIDIHRLLLYPLNRAGMIYPSGAEEYEMDMTL